MHTQVPDEHSRKDYVMTEGIARHGLHVLFVSLPHTISAIFSALGFRGGLQVVS